MSEPNEAINHTAIVDALNARLQAKAGIRAGGTVIPKVVCADGFTLSVQASQFHYCSPRDDHGPWHMVEVGYPSAASEVLLPYAEEAHRPTDTVYGYVPVSIVAQVIADHGGFLAEAA